MGLPFYIVTKNCNFGGKHGVCGFFLPYYPLGSIRDILPFRTLSGTLTFKQQLKWSRQIVSALIYIREASKTFYSDLRADNVLLSKSESDGCEDIVLFDFEQRGNWHEWSGPEILYRMYFESLCAHPSLLAQSRLSQDLVKKQPPGHSFGSHSKGGTSKTGSHGSNPAWFSLSPHAHETAQAYSLGLLFYCIFKCVSNVMVSLANASPYEPNVEFPEFKRTPGIMRDCIRRCTIDAPECELENERITRRGLGYRGFENVVRIDGKLYPQLADRSQGRERPTLREI